MKTKEEEEKFNTNRLDKIKKKKFPIEMLPDCEIEGKYWRESESRRTLKKLQCIMGKYLFDDTGDFT